MSYIPTLTKKDLKVFNDYLEDQARNVHIPVNTQLKIWQLQKEQEPMRDPNSFGGWVRFWDFEKKATFIKDIGNYKIYVFECTHQTGAKFYLGVGFNWLNALSHAYLRKEIKELESKEGLTGLERDLLKELKVKDSAQHKFNWRSQENLIYSSSASRSRAINDVTRFVTRRINSIGTEHKLSQARQQNDQYFCTHGADCVSWKCEVGNTHVKTKDMGSSYIPNIHDLVLFQAFGKKRFGVVVTTHLSQATVAYTTRSTPECIKYKTLHIGSVSPAIDKQTFKPAKVAVV